MNSTSVVVFRIIGIPNGHVERISFQALWAIDARKQVTHSFWYMED